MPDDPTVDIRYATPNANCRSWLRYAKFLLLFGLVILLLAAALWTVERRAAVNYSTGMIRNRVCIFGLPVHTSEFPIFESPRGSQQSDNWRLLTKQGLFGIVKEETNDTTIMSDLRTTLQILTLLELDGKITDTRKRELSQVAWDAATAGDAQVIRAIRIQAEQDSRGDGSNRRSTSMQAKPK